VTILLRHFDTLFTTFGTIITKKEGGNEGLNTKNRVIETLLSKNNQECRSLCKSSPESRKNDTTGHEQKLFQGLEVAR
jgi:hypothetical protein